MRRSKALLAVMMALVLVAGVAPLALAKKGGSGVSVKARVGGQIVLEIASGQEISFEVDPLTNPEDTAETELLVRTNAPRYSIVAEFSDFLIGDYDLIKNEKFFVRSKAPGSGQALEDWTVPKGQLTILKNEDGLTAGETTVVEYKLTVDFTVPPGEGKLQVVFTAVSAF